MAKTNMSEDDDILKDKIEKRFKSMFLGKGEPLSNMTIQEVEALKARVAELETLVAGQQEAVPESQPVVPAEEPDIRPLPLVPAETIHADRQPPLAPAALEKFIGSWVTGISAAAGLASFGISLYFVFVVQRGIMGLSDKILLP